MGYAADRVDSLFDEINDFSLEAFIVQPVDPWNTARADAVDLHQFAVNDVDAHKIESVGDQLILDDLADSLLPRRHPMGKHLAAGVDIGAKVTFFGLPAHGADDFAVEQQDADVPSCLTLFRYSCTMMGSRRA